MNSGPEKFMPRVGSDKSYVQLAHFLDELQKRVDVVAQQFAEIEILAEAAKPMVQRTWGDTFKSAVYEYITQEQYNAMFKDSAVRSHATKLLKDIFDDATDQLKKQPSIEEYQNVIRNLVKQVSLILPQYLDALQGASSLYNNYLKLSDSKKTALDAQLLKETGSQIGGQTGLGSAAFQHLGRIPLMMKTFVDVTEKSSDPEIRKYSKQLHDVLENKIKPKMNEINRKI